MKIPVMKASPLGRRPIENIAQKVLKDFCPAALDELIPLDIEKMFEQYVPKRFAVNTSYEELSMGIHGYTDPSNMRSAVSVDLVESNDTTTVRFGRSTIGHEIGHAILHARQFKLRNLALKFFHDNNHSKPLLYRQEELKAFENPEWQAWEFCKSVFLPAPVIHKAVEDGLSVRQISERVNLHPKFIEVRMKNLKL